MVAIWHWRTEGEDRNSTNECDLILLEATVVKARNVDEGVDG
jgi:hypothetical protein